MRNFIILAFLFCVGSIAGWCLEVFYRRFISAMNPERKWINPGFCSGPWLPLYGFGLAALYVMTSFEDYMPFQNEGTRRLVLFALMAVCMTVIEYIAGLFCLKLYHVRLWDYRKKWGNIQGLICPQFSFFWALLSALYYFLIHPHVTDALIWLSENLAFTFFIGFFYGIFLVDVVNATCLVTKMRRFAKDHSLIVEYEQLKGNARRLGEQAHKRGAFFFPFLNKKPLREQMLDFFGLNDEDGSNAKA